jgi:predicted TIM-barrel fold metal-dependent hydrolase
MLSTMRIITRIAVPILGALVPLSCTKAPVDPALERYIAEIKAVDNHAHPMLPLAPGAPADTEFDALPLDPLPPFSVPVRLRAEHADWIAAARALYGVQGSDTGAAFREEVKAAVARVAKEQGTKSPEWALDRAGIAVMFANRIALGTGLAPPRFRWVAFADPLMLPLDVRAEATRTPDTRSLYPKETALLHRYMRDLGMAKLPASLDDYVKAVVTPTLERQKKGGAVAVKFEAAYLRALDFDDPDAESARRVYARYAAGGVPAHGEYKTLEDYLFRAIAREAGRLGLAVHIHVTDIAGGFYAARGSDPHLLESAFNDTTLRGTNFVIVHGGWPLVEQTMSMLGKPNVYADISMMDIVAEPSQVAAALRLWLGEWPDKVLFGTDAFDGGPEQKWEQGAWLASTSARHALGLALTGMMRDGEITRARAESIARMVMRESALALYHLPSHAPR